MSADDASEPLEIVVTAPVIGAEPGSTVVGADEARVVPGTQGDVVRVVETLPGVARASLGSGDLVIWGAAPQDTRIYVDGVPVPRLYHDGGLRSVIGSSFVASTELIPGGEGASYGLGLGGVVAVTTRSFDDEPHAELSADLFDIAGGAGGPVGDRWSFAVAGRYGYVGSLLTAFYPAVGDYFPIPHDWDGQARVGLRLGPSERVELTALASSDATRRVALSADPARTAAEATALAFQRGSLRYHRDRPDGTGADAVVYWGADRSSLVDSFGPVDTSLEDHVSLVGARASYQARLSRWLGVECGVDAVVARSDLIRRGSLALPPREGDEVVFGQPPPDQISADAFRVVTVDAAPYAEAEVALLDGAIRVRPGLRVDPYVRSVSDAVPRQPNSPHFGLLEEDLRAEPRLSVRYGSATVRALVAYGQYGQQPQASDLSASFGNPALPIATGTHAVASLGGTVRQWLVLDGTAFHTRSEDLAVRNPAGQPARAEALVPTGSGRSSGAQLAVRVAPGSSMYGWMSYTFAVSERRDAAAQDWRLSDYDQRHTLGVFAGARIGPRLDAGLRAQVASGFPRTEVLGAYFDDRRDLYQPIFGGHNAIRLPAFVELDARVAAHVRAARTDFALSLDLQNVTNRVNVEEFAYNADYTELLPIGGLPFLPVLGLRWRS
ncbi:MAG: TonB-dependent receptor plug domain-containing protein [Myxococcota bacterium]